MIEYLQYVDEITAVIVLLLVIWGFSTGRIVSRQTLDSVMAMAERLIKEIRNDDN